MMTEDKLLEAQDVADYIGMTIGWVYREAREDRIPHIKMGRYVKFRRSAIDAWLESRESGKLSRSTNK